MDPQVRALRRPRAGDGRRRDPEQAPPRVSRAEREALVLETLGVFRVASRRSLVDHCFDRHPFAATRILTGLERQGLIKARTVRPPERHGKPLPQHGYQVFCLTGRGRDLVASRRRKRSSSRKRVVSADDQRFWAETADQRQLRHDHQVFDAVAQEVEEISKKGAHVRRVRLESELRGLLAAADYQGREGSDAVGSDVARRACGQQVGLRVFQSGVPLPDAVIEIEHPDGSVTSRSIEVTTSQYSGAQVAAKRAAGFRLYSSGMGWKSQKNQGGRGTADWEEFPLSWAR